MPLVRQRDPNVECLLVGGGLPDALQRHSGAGVMAAGQVEDLAAIFDAVRLTVAPLGYGDGIKGKVVDSLAMGLPCVCTPAAAEGLDLPEALQGCLAAEAEGIAAAICQLHTDETANETCRARLASSTSRQNFPKQQLDAQMRRVVGEHA